MREKTNYFVDEDDDNSDDEVGDGDRQTNGKCGVFFLPFLSEKKKMKKNVSENEKIFINTVFQCVLYFNYVTTNNCKYITQKYCILDFWSTACARLR